MNSPTTIRLRGRKAFVRAINEAQGSSLIGVRNTGDKTWIWMVQETE
jgi:hypothetical protein